MKQNKRKDKKKKDGEKKKKKEKVWLRSGWAQAIVQADRRHIPRALVQRQSATQ